VSQAFCLFHSAEVGVEHLNFETTLLQLLLAGDRFQKNFFFQVCKLQFKVFNLRGHYIFGHVGLSTVLRNVVLIDANDIPVPW